MQWPSELQAARFVGRENRFRAVVEWNGELAAAHVPNSGRLGELFVPGVPVWIAPRRPGAGRKTACDLILVEHAGVLVSVDARLPNKLMAEALRAGRLAPFLEYTAIRPEVHSGGSRLDFLLTARTENGGETKRRCWLETKSVTLVEGDTALFPDAPTDRGVRHLEELKALHDTGDRAAVVFVVQRSDVKVFAPHPTADPSFATALRSAHHRGVEVYAFRCHVSHIAIALTDPVEVAL